MFLRLAAVAAFAAAACAQAQPRPPERAAAALTLEDAVARVADRHPDLRLLDARGLQLAAERDAAVLPPALRAGLELENFAGTGAASGLGGAEATLSLAGVFERGGKLEARRVLAQARIDALAVDRETARLDLLAEVARRWLAQAAAAAQAGIARDDVAQRRRTVDAARRRFQAGASPESVLLTAQAALARADTTLARDLQQHDAVRLHLAALWGERAPRFETAPVDLLALPAIEDADALSALLDATPELARFADARRIGEARLRLAQAAARPDLDWQVGVRRMQAEGDLGLVAGVSIALGSRGRARPEIRAAEAELAVAEVERASIAIALHSTLMEAHGRYRVSALEVARSREAIVPALLRAERAAERAYRGGAASYLEWSQLQAEATAARRQQLEAALEARRALVELQRLTGQPLLAATAGTTTTTTTDTSAGPGTGVPGAMP